MRCVWGLILFLGLASCGFTPLQGVGGENNLTNETKYIFVESIDDKIGMDFRNSLNKKLNPTGQKTDKKYTLNVVLKQSSVDDQIISSENFSTRAKITLIANYKLIELKSNTLLLNASANASGTYNVLKEPYATYTAREKMWGNLTQIVSNKVSLHIFAYFKHKGFAQ